MLDPKIPTILGGIRQGGQKYRVLGVKFDILYQMDLAYGWKTSWMRPVHIKSLNWA